MMRGVASTLEKHHRVQLLDEALEAAVRLSHRYIPARQLPDKAVSLLDTACARVAISQHAVPAEVEDCRRRIEALETELEIIGREEAVGIGHGASARAPRQLDGERARLAELESAGREKALVDRSSTSARSCATAAAGRRHRSSSSSRAARSGCDRAGRESAEAEPRRARSCSPSCTSCRRSSATLQGETPLILPSVDEQAVASVVADWTGIPVGRMVQERDRDGAQARRDAQPARHRPAPRARDDRQAHPDLARRARQSEQADRRVHAVRPVAASARPRPRSRWPRRSTAASRTSSPST